MKNIVDLAQGTKAHALEDRTAWTAANDADHTCDFLPALFGASPNEAGSGG
jgi:hypothetical protein